MAGSHAPHATALAMPFIEDEWWSAENEGRMVDLSNCVQVIICYCNIYHKYLRNKLCLRKNLLMSNIILAVMDTRTRVVTKTNADIILFNNR